MKRHLFWVAVMVLFTAFPTHAQTDSCGYGWLQKHYDTLYPGNALDRAAKGNRVQHYRENIGKIITGHIIGTPTGTILLYPFTPVALPLSSSTSFTTYMFRYSLGL